MNWTAVFLMGAICLNAQQIFYDAKRDKQAADAAAAAKDVAGASVFDKMLRNAGRQTRLELQTGAAWQNILGPGAFDDIEVWSQGPQDHPATPVPSPDASVCVQKSVWGIPDLASCKSLRCRMEALRNQLDVQEAADRDLQAIKARVERIGEITKALQAQIRELQQSEALVQDRFLKPLIDELETGETLFKRAKALEEASGQQILGRWKALGEIETAMGQIQEWAKTLQAIWTSYQAIRQSPRHLLPLHQMLDLDLVAVEQQRLKEQGLIYARLRLDAGNVLQKLNLAQRLFCGQAPLNQCALLNSTDTVEKTLGDLALQARSDSTKRERLLNVVAGLYEAGAAFTQGALGVSLCSLREGAAERDAGIRRAAVSAKATEKAVAEATQRLSLYYKSGITPSQLASLAFSLTSAVTAPVAATK